MTPRGAEYGSDPAMDRDSHVDYPNNRHSYLCRYLDTLLYKNNYKCSNNIVRCCSTYDSDTSNYIDTKDNTATLEISVIVPSSDISVAILHVIHDISIDENNTTKGVHIYLLH